MIGSMFSRQSRRNFVHTRHKKLATASQFAVETLESRCLLAATMGVTGNGASITDGDSTPNKEDFTDFGYMNVATGSVTRQYVVRNTGNSAMSLGSISFIGANPGDFSIINSSTSVAAGESGLVNVRFDPTAAGTRSALMLIPSNDPNHNPYDFTIQGTGLNMTTSSSGLQSATTSAGTGTRVSQTNDNLEVNYTGYLLNGLKFDSSLDSGRTPFKFQLSIKAVIDGWDEGMLNLKLNEKRVLIVPPSLGYGSAGQGNVPPNATMIFEVQLLAFHDGQVKIEGQSGTVANSVITDGDTTPSLIDGTMFSSVVSPGGSLTRTFKISNAATDPAGNLNVTATPSLTISGADAGDFSVSGLTNTTGGVTFVVTFKPRNGSRAVRSAKISFANNDPNHRNFTFDVRGKVNAVAAVGVFRNGLVIADSNGSESRDISDVSYSYGTTGDIPLAGDWNGDGVTDIGYFRGNTFVLDSNGSKAESDGDTSFSFGLAGDKPVVGDWNGDGITDIGVFRGGVFYLDTNGNHIWELNSDTRVFYGSGSDTPVTGDWNGDGKTDVGIFNGNSFFIDSDGNNVYNGTDASFGFGQAGDLPVTGDWNGDGVTDVGVRRGNQYIIDLDADRASGAGDLTFNFGNSNDLPISGYWTKKPIESVGVWRNAQFILDADGSGTANTGDVILSYGTNTDVPIVGDWLGDGIKRVGVYRGNVFILDTDGDGDLDNTDAQFPFGLAGDKPVVGDWNADGKDEVGVFRGGVFYLDLDGNRAWSLASDKRVFYGQASDIPVIGDWNGDGKSDVGIYNGNSYFIDSNGNDIYNGEDAHFNFGIAGDKPFAGDFNGDGTDDVGVFRNGNFYLDTSGNRVFNSGVDLAFAYGATGDTPLIGKWAL